MNTKCAAHIRFFSPSQLAESECRLYYHITHVHHVHGKCKGLLVQYMKKNNLE